MTAWAIGLAIAFDVVLIGIWAYAHFTDDGRDPWQ